MLDDRLEKLLRADAELDERNDQQRMRIQPDEPPQRVLQRVRVSSTSEK
jgi:hypothetical protein